MRKRITCCPWDQRTMANLRIALVQESPDQAFYSGSTVSGSVQLDVSEPKSFKYVSIKFVGRSYVYWEERRTESSGNQQRTVVYKYSSEQPYVDEDAMLWTCQQSPDGKLGIAEYSWPFRFTVPAHAPSSFEGTVGNIRYVLEARVGTGLLKFDHVVEARIPVQQLVRITDPRLLLPERFEAEKTLCCLCCASGSITLNIAVPKTGFCLRETFILHVSVENGSSRGITVAASICQLVLYKARSHQRSSKKTLACYESDPIEGQSSREWDPVIEVPATEIVHEGSCDDIVIQYSLVVAAKIPQAVDISRSIPIQLSNCSVQQQGGQSLAPPSTPPATFPPPSGAPYPPTSGAPYPPPSGAPYPPPSGAPYPPTSGAPYPPPSGAPYPPTSGAPPDLVSPYPSQPPPGVADAPGDWQMPYSVPPPAGLVQPATTGKPPDLHSTSSESSVNSDTARLL